eukprot:gene26159-32694_t
MGSTRRVATAWSRCSCPRPPGGGDMTTMAMDMDGVPAFSADSYDEGDTRHRSSSHDQIDSDEDDGEDATGARKKRHKGGGIGGGAVDSKVKIALSLYKVQQNIYLLDFQRVEGDAFGFMKLCAFIITELKNLSAASRASSAPSSQQVQGRLPHNFLNLCLQNLNVSSAFSQLGYDFGSSSFIEDLLTFGRTTVVEDPYDKVQRMAKLRAKSGISLIDESELDQGIIAAEKKRATATDYDSAEFLQPLDGLNDADYQDLMSSFMEFDD